jgi:hypothetical protein
MTKLRKNYMAQKHLCSVCENEFDSEEEYIAHKCTTGFTPADVEHQDALTGGKFSLQAEKALERGEARLEE